jgi:hypothetical protein
MDEKFGGFINDCTLIAYWMAMPNGTGTALAIAESIYHAGCAAQSKEDRRIIQACSLCKYKEYETCRKALAAAAIVEKP